MSFSKYIIGVGDGPRISLHLLVAVLAENLQENKTDAEAKEAIEAWITKKNNGESVTLTPEEAGNIGGVIAWVKAGADAFQKRNRLDEFYRVIMLAGHGTWYNTIELLDARLGW